MLRIVLHTRGRWKFSLADIQKIFCRSDLWSKISHVLVGRVSCAAWNVFSINSLLTGPCKQASKIAKIDCFCFQTPFQTYFHHCVLLIVYVYCQVFNGPQKPSCRTLYCIVWHIAIQYTLPILFFDKFMYRLRTFFEKVGNQ